MMTKEDKEWFCLEMGWPIDSRLFRIKGHTEVVKAGCLKEAVKKLVGDNDVIYTPHWFTRSYRNSYAEVETSWGYHCIVEEI